MILPSAGALRRAEDSWLAYVGEVTPDEHVSFGRGAGLPPDEHASFAAVLRCVVHALRRPNDNAPVVVAIIPARYHSTRLPGKPLIDLAGRPLIEHVYRRVEAVPDLAAVLVATDDERIQQAVEAFGGGCVMTSAEHRSGTDRLAEAAAALDCDIVVNVQGDEPFIEPAVIRAALGVFRDPSVQMSTLRVPLESAEELRDPNLVKVVVDAHGDALYFSRAPVPWARDAAHHLAPGCTFKHVGLYAYRREFLIRLAALPPTPLERVEQLEQLRVLEHGFRIRTVLSAHDSLGVDTPADLERARRLLEALPGKTTR